MYEDAGLEVLCWYDATEVSSRWFEKMQSRVKTQTPSPLGLHLLLGPDAGEKIANMIRSLSDGHATVIMAVIAKPAAV